MELFKFVVTQLARGAAPSLVNEGYLKQELAAEPCPQCRKPGTMHLVGGSVWRGYKRHMVQAFECAHCTGLVLPELT